MKGIILHGGAGTRLRPLTHTGPKQLIPVANKPISQYVLESLRDAGINDIALVLGDVYPEKVKEYYGDGSRFGVKISYVFQGEPKGIAHAIGLCREFVGDQSFVVHLGDDLIKGGVKKYVEEFVNSGYDGMILLCRVREPHRFGVAEFNKNGNLVRLVEKPKEPPSDYALSGVYFFKPVIFNMIDKLKPSWRGELEITEAIQLLLENGNSLGHRFVDGWWKDTGTLENILESNRLVLDEFKSEILGVIEDKASIQGRVYVGEGTVVKNGAVIRGPASIGRNTLVDANVYIGPYTSIGNNVRIKRGEIENSIIMDDCQIEIDNKITDSLIGPCSEIIENNNHKPKGHRLVIGERSKITL
jgi:glucose-1-phosphate thymidylyltransferase